EKSSGMDMAEPANVLAKHEPERKPKQASGYKFKARRPEPASVSQKSSAVKVFPAVIFQIQEDELNDPLQYVDHAEVRNYSNEKAAEPELPLVVDMNGMPYVPSASFSYMPETDTLQPDVLQQNKIKALLAIGKVKTAEIQSELNEQINRSRNDLRLLKKQSLKLIEQRQKKLQPALRKIQEDMQIKKAEIKQMQMELQIQNGEIIPM
ncbi:MAG: hypothetical protein Q8926_11885, partial [Bacteroidota bacterium]|nr:hypothetical protein [Bacteroidota bacterium]